MKIVRKIAEIFTIILVFVFFLIGFHADASAQQQKIKDIDITRAIETDLLFDDSVESHLIDVSTFEGIVTLEGSVSNMLAREQADRIASSIKGVLSVVNQIKVNPVKRNDMEIRSDVKKALLWDPATDSYEVDVQVNNGIVTLTGEVESWAEKQLSAKVAKSVRGIREVSNQIKIVYKGSRSDSEIRPEIEKRLELDPYVNHENIKVEVKNGKVDLIGIVGSVTEKTQAYSDAWVSGVDSVNNAGLKIEWWAREKMRRKVIEAQTDAQIKETVNKAFFYDPRVYSFKIDVGSEDGIVTLSGTVDNYKSKKAAEQDAMNTKGVVAVYNNIKVRTAEMPDDDEIAEKISKAMLWDPVVDRYEIAAIVLNQKAYLYGEVDTYYEKERAEDIASKVAGVAAVQNSLSVANDWQWMADNTIKEQIEDQLFWSWFVDSDDISVEVEKGVATLTGEADGLQQVYYAVANAFEGGARVVESRLKVVDQDDYYPLYHYKNYYNWPAGVWALQYSDNQ